jgi:opacity protein-like surface antigen
MHRKIVLATLFLAATLPASAQVTPSFQQRRVPLVVGVGFSNFNTDWNGRLSGATFWADWNFNKRPSFLQGFGIEVEGRDLNYGRSSGAPKNLRQDTLEGGVIYTWRHYRNFHPYGKFIAGLGSIDFQHIRPTYSHDTRAVWAPGGGVEYRAWQNVWVRGDYEYQFWPDFFSYHALNPNGVTIGVSYDFGHIHAR